MMTIARTDQQWLRGQYAQPDNLNARIRLHREFSTNPGDFVRWLFDQVQLTEGAAVLEVGCGPGWLWRKNSERVPASWSIQLSDFSPGMAAAAGEAVRACGLEVATRVCDAQDLPFDDASFDILFANHMLYHVPDLTKALGEFARVLKPTGALYAATNGRRHLKEMDELVATVRPGARFRSPKPMGFALDAAEADLAPHFARIEKIEYRDDLEVTEAGPLIDFIASTREVDAALRRDLEAEINRAIAAEGHYWIGKQPGLMVAREPH